MEEVLVKNKCFPAEGERVRARILLCSLVSVRFSISFLIIYSGSSLSSSSSVSAGRSLCPSLFASFMVLSSSSSFIKPVCLPEPVSWILVWFSVCDEHVIHWKCWMPSFHVFINVADWLPEAWQTRPKSINWTGVPGRKKEGGRRTDSCRRALLLQIFIAPSLLDYHNKLVASRWVTGKPKGGGFFSRSDHMVRLKLFFSWIPKYICFNWYTSLFLGGI